MIEQTDAGEGILVRMQNSGGVTDPSRTIYWAAPEVRSKSIFISK